jgi:lipid-binding SYLF domain-containing protein
MKKILLILFVIFIGIFSFSKTVNFDTMFADSLDVLQQITEAPDGVVFKEILSRAKGVVIYPSMIKAGLVVGGSYGEGFLLRKDSNNVWYGPLFLKMTGVSVGFQVGISKTGLILVLMNETAFNNFTQDNNVTLGGNAGIAAGPLGRSFSAETDYTLDASIYSYSISKGAYAGLSIEGSVIEQFNDATIQYYGQLQEPQNIIYNIQATGMEVVSITDYIDETVEKYLKSK